MTVAGNMNNTIMKPEKRYRVSYPLSNSFTVAGKLVLLNRKTAGKLFIDIVK